MSRSDTWMPLYVADYLGDTGHLMGPEHGAYLLLMMHYWRTGPLPDDDAILARIARTEAKPWRAMAAMIRGFFRAEAGLLHHKRIDAERAKAADLASKRAAAAGARWQRGASKPDATDMHAASGCNAIASGLHDKRIPQVQSQEQKAASDLRSGAAAAPGSAGGGLFGEDLPPDRAASMRAALFRDGVPILIRLTGKADGACRALLGRLLQAAADDCAGLYRAIREAESAPPADPGAWLAAAARRLGGGRGDPAGKGGRMSALIEQFGGR
jgi:uncharacterized protein YdaU (DUF1376 family)